MSSKNPWEEYKKQIKPLSQKKGSENSDAELKRKNKENISVKFDKENDFSNIVAKGYNLTPINIDKKTLNAIKNDKLKFDAVLDLHGRTIEEACGLLFHFIKSNYVNGKRILRIITGVGRRSKEGQVTIKSQFSKWIFNSEISSFILSSTPAMPKHGGNGAYYVILRKKR
jgi:hypothetical protein